jgi:hypothetical protein
VSRLFQMALELEPEGEHVRMIRAAERAPDAHQEKSDRPLRVNVDGAIAAIPTDPRQQPMRQIDPKDHD